MTTVLQRASLEVHTRIVAAAVLAPSAENTQPWHFVVDGDALTVCLDTSRMLSSDIGQMLGLTAIGTCIENAVIAAAAQGWRADVEYLPESLPTRSQHHMLPIARVQLADGADRDPLVDGIESRCTSRRMDHRRMVDDAVCDQLRQSCNGFLDVELHWADLPRLWPFAKLVGIGNRIRFEHRPFHAELYDSLRFTEGEARRTRDGLDVATLQLPLGVAGILRMLRTWPRMRWANVFGFSRSVARQAAQEVYRSGAVGFLTVSSPDADQFVEGGRALERLWLTATMLGLCFHPTASLPVFLAHARTGGQQLLPQHQRLAKDMSERFYRLFPEAAGRIVQMAFRIGYGPAPPVRSLRRPASSVLDLK